MTTISLKNSDTLFLTVCMSGQHTYLTVGSQNEQGECTMLMDVGKAIPHDQRQRGPIPIFMEMFFGVLDAEIMNEQKLLRPGKRKQSELPS